MKHHPTIHRIDTHRNLMGQTEAEVAYDADGNECLRVEYHTDSGTPSWVNIRADLLDGQDPSLLTLHEEFVGKPFHHVLSDGYQAFQERVAASDRAAAERVRVVRMGMTCDATPECLNRAERIIEGVPCCHLADHVPGERTPAVYGVAS
jgi:hypothetical protein